MKTYIISEGRSIPVLREDLGPQPDAANFRFPVGRGVTVDGLNLRVSMPAVFDEDFAFTIDDRGLLLFGTRREPPRFGEAKKFALRYGDFEQRIALPTGVGGSTVEARFHHGVLDIHLRCAAVAVAMVVPGDRCTEAFAVACGSS